MKISKFKKIKILLVLAVPFLISPGFSFPSDGTEIIKEKLSECSWKSINGPFGGPVQVLQQDPYNPDCFYVGTTRGIFVSDNEGDSWELITEEYPNNFSMAVTKERIFVSAQKFYYVDREKKEFEQPVLINEYCNSVYSQANKIYIIKNTTAANISALKIKSSDADTLKWKTIFDTTTNSALKTEITKLIGNYNSSKYILQVNAFIPINSRAFLISVAITDEISITPDYFIKSQVFYTQDEGINWQPVTVPVYTGQSVYKIIQDSNVNTHLILFTKKNAKPAEGYLETYDLSKIVFESKDGGKTWKKPLLTNPFTNNVYAVVNADIVGNTLYFCHIQPQISEIELTTGKGILHELEKIPWGTRNLIFFDLVFDSQNSSTVFGVENLKHAHGNGIFRTKTPFHNWEWKCNNMVASPVSLIMVNPDNPDIILTGGNTGLIAQVTHNGGKNWMYMANSAEMADEFAFDIFHPKRIIMMDELAQFQVSNNMGISWKPLAPEFNGSRVIDIEISEKSSGMLYSSNMGIGISNLKDSNTHLDNLFKKNLPLKGGKWAFMNYSPDYCYDFAIDNSNASDILIYAAYSPKKFENYSAIYKYSKTYTQNSGWKEILHVGDSAGTTSVVINPKVPAHVWAGITGKKGLIYKTEDGGNTFKKINEYFSFVTVHEIAVDPNNDSIAYAAPWGGGLYKTKNSGKEWTQMDTPTNSIVTVIIDPKDSNHIFIGDRNGPNVFETKDQGKNWQYSVGLKKEQFYRVFAMAMHKGNLYISVMNKNSNAPGLFVGKPSGSVFKYDFTKKTMDKLENGDMDNTAINLFSNGKNLYAVGHIEGVYKLEKEIWKSITYNLPDIGFNNIIVDANDQFYYITGGSDLDFSFNNRVMGDKSIINQIYVMHAGKNKWEPLKSAALFPSPAKKLLMNPKDSKCFYAATEKGLFISTDAGKTWGQSNINLGFQNIGSLAVGKNSIYAGTLGGGAYRGVINNLKVNWEPSSGPFPTIHNIQIKLDPQNPNNIIYASSFPGGLFKSSNAGQTWHECNFGLPTVQVEDPLIEGYYSLEIDPSNTNILYLVIYRKGLFKSLDGGNTFRPMYGKNFVNAQYMNLPFTKIKVNPVSTDHIFIATYSGIYISTDGAQGSQWFPINNGLGTLRVNTLQSDSKGRIYAGTDGYGIYVYDKAKNKWEHLARNIGFGDWFAWERRLYQYGAFCFDKEEPGLLYLGHFPSGFFISHDYGESWEASNIGMGNDGIFSVTIDPDNHNTIWVGTYNGVYVSNDKGHSFRDSSTGMPPEQWPFEIIIDTKDTKRMYVVTKNGKRKGFAKKNLDPSVPIEERFAGYVGRSDNAGQIWYDIMQGLPREAEYYSLVIHPDNHNILFVSSSLGIFASVDSGDSWMPLVKGLPALNNQVRENVAGNLKLIERADGKIILLYGLNYYGIWELDITGL